MPIAAEIRTLTALPPDIHVLRLEAAKGGLRFIDRLVDEWETAANRFDAPGETLAGAFQGERLVAVCGLNVDPYTPDSGVGRLRHLYVLEGVRRHGIASALVRHLMDVAERSFVMVRVRTDTKQAAIFYEAWGTMPQIMPSYGLRHYFSFTTSSGFHV